jgi:uncharacterized membrane protein YhaH (DUF805 family)
MESFASIFSASGRLAPRPFAIGAVAIYVASFLSQFLLAAPVTARASVFPFLLVQMAIAWLWYALHVRRLRDAGRAATPALALTILFALAVILLLLATAAINAPGTAGTADDTPFGGAFRIILILFLIGSIMSDPNLGMFGVIILTVLALVMLPIVIATAFTIWAATRPSAPAAPS